MRRGIRLGPWSKLFAPGYGSCELCGTPWRFVEPRMVPKPRHGAFFALCVKCWDDTTLPDRLRYFRASWGRWWAERMSWDMVRDAVTEASRQEARIP